MSAPAPLTLYRCAHCGRLHHPFHDRCLDCKRRDFDIIHPQGNARLLTYTVIVSLPEGFDQPALILGLAEFENGARALGQIKTGSAKELRTGMAVASRWETILVVYGQPIHGIKFEPLE